MKMITVFIFILSLNVWSHGNGPGPHGGKIMMPGNFHTELVIIDSEIKIYLLDMKFEKPTIENSSVKVSIEHHGNKEALTCTPNQDVFVCKFKGPKSMISRVEVEAQRIKAKGKAVYDFKTAEAASSHMGH